MWYLAQGQASTPTCPCLYGACSARPVPPDCAPHFFPHPHPTLVWPQLGVLESQVQDLQQLTAPPSPLLRLKPK